MLFINTPSLVTMTAAGLLTGVIIVIISLIAVGIVGVTIAAFLWNSRRKISE